MTLAAGACCENYGYASGDGQLGIATAVRVTWISGCQGWRSSAGA